MTGKNMLTPAHRRSPLTTAHRLLLSTPYDNVSGIEFIPGVSTKPKLPYNRGMPLPILKTPVESDLIRLFHRMTLHYTQHLGETTPLDVGTAISNPSLSAVYDANVVLDAALPEGVSAEDAFMEANTHFAQQGCVCHKWVMNPSAKSEATKPLVDYLLERGAGVMTSDILYLAKQPQAKVREISGLRIIPARASYRHAKELAEQSSVEEWDCPELADAHMLHLDDPHVDALIALRDGQPIAGVAVLAVGEGGLIEDVYVAPEVRRQGVGRTMMSRAMEICARSLFKHVMLAVLPDNAPAQALYASLGFKKIGVFTSYCPGGAPTKKSPFSPSRSVQG